MGRMMTAHVEVMDLVAQMKAAEQAFVLATVVRTVSVTAAKAGAKAIIRPDGMIVAGWIGGGCARGAVLKAATATASASPATCVPARAPWISSLSRCCRTRRW
jgi:xanthine/CO dehydrogenase XdhC/CoxF family maturation factor